MRSLCVAVILVICATANAQDVRNIYSKADLERTSARIGPKLQGMWDEDFLSRLTRSERSRGGAVSLFLPLVGGGNPIEFYSSPKTRRVYLPIASVKFLDDLAIATAYFDVKHCDTGAVSDYVAAITVRPQLARGSPLDALGIPANALEDEYVDDVSAKVTKSTVYFLAAHEYAHVMYGHQDYTVITAEEAQRQESEADAFALEMLRRIGVPPIGLVQFFLVASRIERSPGDFGTLQEYEDYLHQSATHPLSGLRIQNIAEGIERNTADFARLQRDPAATITLLRGSARDLREIGRNLDDRRMRIMLADRARNVDVSSLRRTCTK